MDLVDIALFPISGRWKFSTNVNVGSPSTNSHNYVFRM